MTKRNLKKVGKWQKEWENTTERETDIEREGKRVYVERPIYLQKYETYKNKKRNDNYKFNYYEDLKIYCGTIGM